MVYLKINDILYPAEIRGRTYDKDWDNRESLAVTVAMAYEEAVSLFVDDITWGHIYQGNPHIDENGETITPDPEIYDDSEYSIAGPITDNRDGTVTCKMGKLLDSEALAIILGEV